jgi:hypothetical protein
MNRASRLTALALVLGISACGNEMAPAGLSYTANPAVYAAGAPITANAPRFGGGNPDSFSVNPSLPAGLSLSRTSGVISGTPTDPVAAADYVISCGNSGGTSTVLLRLAVSPASAPVIVTAPATQVVALDQPVTFSVTATGTGALTYHWHRDGAELSGQAGTSLTTDPVTYLDDDAEFTVTVTDHWGGSATSSPAKIRLEGFIATADMRWARQAHTATRLGNGRVLVSGGFNGEILAHADLYDPATGLFIDTGDLTAPRQNQTASLLPDGRVLLVGGQGGPGGGTPLASAEIYDPGTGTFSPAGPTAMATPRYYHTATALPDGTVLVTGGRFANGGAAVSDGAEVFVPATGTFLPAGTMNVARYWHTATLLKSGLVLITGGYGSAGGAVSSAELYDPASGLFTETAAPMLEARYGHTATTVGPDGLVLLAGGYGAGFLASAELYEPVSQTFSSTGALGEARQFHAATALPGGQVLFSGGLGTTDALSSAEIYDFDLGAFRPTGSMEAERYLATATLLESGEVLVLGGWSMSNFGLPSAELFSGLP